MSGRSLPFLAFALVACALLAFPVGAQDAPNTTAADFRRTFECPGPRYCSRVRSCREAVHSWCVCGYTRADADKDGVPCENLCGDGTDVNRARVGDIMAVLECRPPR